MLMEKDLISVYDKVGVLTVYDMAIKSKSKQLVYAVIKKLVKENRYKWTNLNGPKLF